MIDQQNGNTLREESPSTLQKLPKVVAVDDDRQILDYYRSTLKGICEIYLFETATEALHFILNNSVALAIVDRKLSYSQAIKLLKMLRQIQEHCGE